MRWNNGVFLWGFLAVGCRRPSDISVMKTRILCYTCALLMMTHSYAPSRRLITLIITFDYLTVYLVTPWSLSLHLGQKRASALGLTDAPCARTEC